MESKIGEIDNRVPDLEKLSATRINYEYSKDPSDVEKKMERKAEEEDGSLQDLEKKLSATRDNYKFSKDLLFLCKLSCLHMTERVPDKFTRPNFPL